MKNRYMIVTENDDVILTDDTLIIDIDVVRLIIDTTKKQFTFDLQVWYKIEIRNC
jgi:hypothetical protein